MAGRRHIKRKLKRKKHGKQKRAKRANAPLKGQPRGKNQIPQVPWHKTFKTSISIAE